MHPPSWPRSSIPSAWADESNYSVGETYIRRGKIYIGNFSNRSNPRHRFFLHLHFKGPVVPSTSLQGPVLSVELVAQWQSYKLIHNPLVI